MDMRTNVLVSELLEEEDLLFDGLELPRCDATSVYLATSAEGGTF
jgi:hypothetical protein